MMAVMADNANNPHVGYIISAFSPKALVTPVASNLNNWSPDWITANGKNMIATVMAAMINR
jgi:hypothetical protein